MATGFTIGPMRGFEKIPHGAVAAAPEISTVEVSQPRLRHMLIPIVSLIGGVLLGLWSTGDGDITAGNGSKAILYAVVGTMVITAILLRVDRVFTSAELEKKILTGCADFIDVGILIVLALALGKLTQDLGTGPFIAQMLQSSMPVAVIPALIFVLGAITTNAIALCPDRRSAGDGGLFAYRDTGLIGIRS